MLYFSIFHIKKEGVSISTGCQVQAAVRYKPLAFMCR